MKELEKLKKVKGLLSEFYPECGTIKNTFYVKDSKYNMDPRKSLWRRTRAGLQNVKYVENESETNKLVKKI